MTQTTANCGLILLKVNYDYLQLKTNANAKRADIKWPAVESVST